MKKLRLLFAIGCLWVTTAALSMQIRPSISMAVALEKVATLRTVHGSIFYPVRAEAFLKKVMQGGSDHDMIESYVQDRIVHAEEILSGSYHKIVAERAILDEAHAKKALSRLMGLGQYTHIHYLYPHMLKENMLYLLGKDIQVYRQEKAAFEKDYAALIAFEPGTKEIEPLKISSVDPWHLLRVAESKVFAGAIAAQLE